jgi:hypothetical protein
MELSRMEMAYRIALLCKRAATGEICRDDSGNIIRNEIEYLLHASDALIRDCLAEMDEEQVSRVIEKLDKEGLINDQIKNGGE